MKIKNIEENKFYYEKKRKVKYTTYISRVVRYWRTKEDAVKVKPPFTRRTRLKRTEQWRECSQCWIFKSWFDFSKDKTNPTNNYRSANCKECRNEYKRKYRESNNKDKEYKKQYLQSEYWKQQSRSYNYFIKVYWESLEKLKDLWEIKTKADITKLKKNVLIRDGKEKEFNLLFKK